MSEWITPGELARVRRQHPDIPQEPLVAVDPGDARPEPDPKPAAPKPVRWEKCPDHFSFRRTGLILVDGQLVFRDHSRTVGRHRLHCTGSGKPLQEATDND